MRRKMKLLTGLLFVLLLSISTTIYANAGEYVIDRYDFLSENEEDILESELSEIYDTYGFEAVLLISENVYTDERMYAAEFMQENEIGYGEEMDGLCIFHQPDDRIITIVFRGKYQDDFTVKIQDIMLDSCIEDLKAGNELGAYFSLIDDVDQGLERAVNGKKIRPMDIEDDGIIGYAAKWLALSFGIMAIPVLILVLIQFARMRTKTPQKNADFYAPEESFDLQMCRDIYLRTDVKRTKIERDNHGSGKSGSFRSGGESFSGSSRKY